MKKKSFLIVSEQFYSIQGEGVSTGTPAVFLRLTGCNLRCPGFSYQNPITKEHLGCDTALVWRQGQRQLITAIVEQWQQNGWLEHLRQGAHLVITGGEPMLQEPGILELLTLLDQQTPNIYVEMETNATLPYSAALLERIQQFNVSPKLQHSGEPLHKAYHPAILAQLAKRNNVFFKFVIATPDDMQEVMEKFIEPFQINRERVLLMPEGATLDLVRSRSLMVIELCKQYRLKFSPRLHILIWDQATGV